MFKTLISVICLTVMIIPASAAQNNIRPGLWEVTTTSDLLALVPHIPSEQMQQITHLARQYGLIMPKIQNNAATSQVCITQAMAAQDIPTYFYDGQSGCSVKNATRSGNRFQIDLICDNAQFQGSGTAEGIFTSPEEFTGHTEFDTIVMGNPVFATAETRGRWIGERCTVVQSAQPAEPVIEPSAVPEFYPIK
ncbi:MAG: DUF3617 domain-containing protein [Burkholderiales bacterium]|nr:DUF3617 domain-containing protein [Nitrosomonas sp.]MCP5274572.1 DUF3617 domain-containing protein [Burkholderiales bacterium]